MLTSIIGIGLNGGSAPRRVRADGWPAASLQDVLPAGQPLPLRFRNWPAWWHQGLSIAWRICIAVARPDFMPPGRGWCDGAPCSTTWRPLNDRRGKVMRNKEVSGRAGHPSAGDRSAGARFPVWGLIVMLDHLLEEELWPAKSAQAAAEKISLRASRRAHRPTPSKKVPVVKGFFARAVGFSAGCERSHP